MKLPVVVVAAALVFGFAAPAISGPIGGPPPAFNVLLGSDVAGSERPLTPTLTPNGDGTYSASGSETVDGAYSIVFDFTLNPDPVISGSFMLTSLSTSTQTFSVAATLGTSVAGPTSVSGSFGEVTYTDLNDGTLGVGANPFYRAEIDGLLVQALGSFFFNPISGGPGIVLTQSPESFSGAGPGVTSAMGVVFPGFMLTAGDKIEVDFEFVVVPEPSSVSFFAISFALILRRFARERASCR